MLLLFVCNLFPEVICIARSLLSRRPQYQPLTLKRLQYLIDLGRVDTTQPIDLTQLVNARGVTVQPLKRDYGVQLVDEVCVGGMSLSYQNYQAPPLSFMSLKCLISLVY